MLESFCGKSCQACPRRAELSCPGCKSGMYDFSGGQNPAPPKNCPVAQCAQEKNQRSCESCPQAQTCATLSCRAQMPDLALNVQTAQAAERSRRAEEGRPLGKWLWLLFWSVIPQALASILSNETLFADYPVLRLIGSCLSLLVGIGYALILLRLSFASRHYHQAGVLSLVAMGLLLPALLCTALLLAYPASMAAYAFLAVLLSLAPSILALVATYQEFQGHAQVLELRDPEAARKWHRLWGWYIGCFAALLASGLLALIPILGLLVILAASVGLIVVAILRLIYLYRTAQYFRNL